MSQIEPLRHDGFSLCGEHVFSRNLNLQKKSKIEPESFLSLAELISVDSDDLAVTHAHIHTHAHTCTAHTMCDQRFHDKNYRCQFKKVCEFNADNVQLESTSGFVPLRAGKSQLTAISPSTSCLLVLPNETTIYGSTALLASLFFSNSQVTVLTAGNLRLGTKMYLSFLFDFHAKNSISPRLKSQSRPRAERKKETGKANAPAHLVGSGTISFVSCRLFRRCAAFCMNGFPAGINCVSCLAEP